MDTAMESALRDQLQDRRERLQETLGEVGQAPDLLRLLREVDLALEKVGGPDFGVCEVCDGKVDDDVLQANPLARYCLCDLSPEQQQDLQRDLSMASRVQWALLPEENLCASGWEVHYRYLPVGLVSGDYCDTVACRESGVLHFMLGDVSGKGVSAAFFMARLSALFRTLVGEGLPVEGLVSRANDLFAGSTLASQYATLVYGRAYADGRVELCNAGHCRPILLRGGESTCLESTGLPVGLFAGNPYQVKIVELSPGDTLLLYTDGVTEARNPKGEEFGEERLCRVLEETRTPACCGLAKALLADLDDFASGVPRKDDLTVMVIRRDDAC